MPSNAAKNPSTRYGLLVFLILSLFLCAIFFYIRNNKNQVLTDDINELVSLKEDYAQIDSCIILLYNADNNSRLFAVTGEKSYIKKFSSEIAFVSTILDNINRSAEEREKVNPQNIRGLVDQKRTRTELYLKLRQLTDSLIYVSAGIDTATDRTKIGLGKEVTYSQFKTMITVDTIRSGPKPVQEKGLLGRLGDALSRKKREANAVADTTVTIVRKETKLDTSLQSRNYNRLQLRNMNNYFRNLYNANNMLKRNEVVILQINNRIITEIVNLLQSYKKREIKFAASSRNDLNENIQGTFKSIDRIVVFSIGLLLTLVVAILYNLYKIFKNEGELVNYSQKASQYANSKSRFLANMSHEIRTPLNSVIGFSEQLSKGDLNEQQSEQVSAIRSSSVMLLDVVNDILDFSKYETGKVNFDKVSFKPYDAVMDVFNSIGIQATNKGIALKKDVSFPENLCYNGDSLRLKQVIMNLLSNAIKFTDNGSVTLKASVIPGTKKQSVLKIQIVDTGIGIAPEDLDLIFDEFAQVYYSSTKIKQKGTGLGLAICKKIVEFQGGRIGVTSELGKGSVFSFEIPYEISTAENNKEIVKAEVVNAEGLVGKRILLADDNKMNILLAQTVLKKYKMASDVAYDGVQALALFEQNDYDLILTDIQMPEMGGVELTRLIRAYKNLEKSKIPILGVTANVLQEDRDKYIDSGINDLVLKPFSEKELVDKIASYIL
ncbi:hybrid sensor histidine kinase/response regulator [Pedobacter namyangjuensis]|uniref:hybrid sensor histidine kinase/response regulator n=1 Tax=Pedobacter namyangjuensis TaxID=600626 RepID=UPI000DE35140|nr:ATP-binding protein [Pedobacter namyangjuensis]